MKTEAKPVKKKGNGLLWAARILGFIIIAFIGTFLIPEIITAIKGEVSFIPEEESWRAIVGIVGFSLLLVGYILAWIKEGIGGTIMVLSGLTVSLPYIIFSDDNSLFINLLILGFTIIVAGLLFIIYWRDMRKKKSATTSH